MSAVGHSLPLPRARPHVGRPARVLTLVFATLPLWWLAGLYSFTWQIVGFFLLLALLRRRSVVFPRGFGIWLLFLAWVPLAALQLKDAGDMLLFAQRLSVLASATIIFLYVFNSSRERLPDRTIVNALTLYWAMLVVGGFLGVLFPNVSFHSPIEKILPGGLLGNPFVHDQVHVYFAQVHTFLGYPVGRPSAFFTYTNTWGSILAVLTPFVFAALADTKSALRRKLLAALLVLSAIPIVVSLNRGVWLALGLGLTYAFIRFALSRQLRAVAVLASVAALVVTLLFVTPVGGLVTERLANPHSNTVREALYAEAIDRSKESPLVGYGGPQPSEHYRFAAPVGTHSQLLFVVFSYGIPAVVFFTAWFGLTLLRSAKGTTAPRFWAHVAILIFLIEAPYYLLDMHLAVVMIAAALLWREIARRETVVRERPDELEPAARHSAA